MDRIVRRTQLLELIGVSSTTQWRMERRDNSLHG